MSNEYKDWEKERAIEAWDDLIKISEIFEKWRENGSGEGIVEGWLIVKNILEKGGWI